MNLQGHATADTSARLGIILFAFAMGGFVLGTTEFASMSLLPQIARTYGVAEPQAAHAISLYALGVVVGAPIITVLSAKLPRRALLIGLVGLMFAGNALSAFAPSLSWFLLFRFISGLPHGAYFGVAAVLAASLVPKKKRAQAVSRMLLGLTVATIVGVPFATGLGQTVGWRAAFGVVAVLAGTTMVMIRMYSPNPPPRGDASPLKELKALRSGQVWLTLAIGAVGFGGLFCVYTYLSSTLTDVTHVSAAWIPFVFAMFGIGSTVGTLVCGWAADNYTNSSAGVTLVFSVIVLALYPLMSGSIWSITIMVFLVGCSVGLSTILQTRLMDVAENAPALGGALIQSAFNVANSIGPWVGGLIIAHGYGIKNTGYGAAALALGGLMIWGYATYDAHRQERLMR